MQHTAMHDVVVVVKLLVMVLFALFLQTLAGL
jgi:hypothetical protein